MKFFSTIILFLTLIYGNISHNLPENDEYNQDGIMLSAFPVSTDFWPDASSFKNLTISDVFPAAVFLISNETKFKYKPEFKRFFPLELLDTSNLPSDLTIVLQFGNYTENNGIVFQMSYKMHREESSGRSSNLAIIGGIVGVTVTNLCSVFGIFCIPIQRWKHYPFVLTFMVALAIAALSSTSLLVLLPEALNLHTHGEDVHLVDPLIIKLMITFFGVIFFYTMEYTLMQLPNLRKCTDQIVSSEVAPNDPVRTDFSSIFDSTDGSLEPVGKSRYCICPDFECSGAKLAKVAPVAWMILFGDGVHNFMDGLTIGAGFTRSISIGIMLSISILLEELPHELGDFAILLSSGFSVKAAIICNFLSSCTAYVGLGIGLATGNVPSGAAFVFAITAGFFLYISLSDMLPELRQDIENVNKKGGHTFCMFSVQMAGIGVGLLCIVAVILTDEYIQI